MFPFLCVVEQHFLTTQAQAAFARTATRAIALYFSRPVRLFRPSKGMGIASHDGASLSPQYVSSLVKNQGFTVIAKHFWPPILVNTLLGTILFTSYTNVSGLLETHTGHHPTLTAALSGGIAGGAQALVAAPAENVRILIEGGTVYHSWSHAWKDVFRGTQSRAPRSRMENIEDVRELRRWMKEVGDMAGRGWNGWGWTLAKDVCGFAVFFSVFSITRRIALDAKAWSESLIVRHHFAEDGLVANIPRVVHGFSLVAGGVLAGLGYEFTIRPWEHARQTVRLTNLHRVAHPSEPTHSLLSVLLRQLREDWLAFFRDPVSNVHNVTVSVSRRRIFSALRTLARVGPWGVSFLAWEIFGPTLDSEHDEHDD
uniref:Mitochondrial carrier n=1 Tax=Moniliophthora roreri TaxID=221103 RepID=A0A0W0FZU2_MONRR